MLCQQAEHALSAAPRIPNASVATQAWQDEARAERGCKSCGRESWGYPGENELTFASQPAPVSFWPKACRGSLKSTLPSSMTGVHCSPGWASPLGPSHWSVQLLPRCLHGLKLKATATPRVPERASESISYHSAGPGLDSQLGLGEQTTATPQAQASLLKENVGGTKPRPQLHSSLEGLTHQQVGIQGGEAKTVTEDEV